MKQEDVRLNDRTVDPLSHFFLHANISSGEERKERERKDEWIN